MELMGDSSGKITILAGSGGNGGGGLCYARHLLKHGCQVSLNLTKPADQLHGAAKSQWMILEAAGVSALSQSKAQVSLSDSQLVIVALIGYSLSGPPRGETRRLI